MSKLTNIEVNAKVNKWIEDHREKFEDTVKKYYSGHRNEFIARIRKWVSSGLNKNGVPKNTIRTNSRSILEKCHSKLPGYEIHHCFGYEYPGKFIYIPKSLHSQIHQFLRDNNISTDEDHWRNIAEIVNECEEYTYIRT